MRIQVSIEGTCFYHKLNLKLFFLNFQFTNYIVVWHFMLSLLFLHNSFRSSSWPLTATVLPIGRTLFWTSPRKKEYAGVSSKWDHRPLLNSKPDHLYKMNMSPTVYIMPDVHIKLMEKYTVLSRLREYSTDTRPFDTWKFLTEFAVKQIFFLHFEGHFSFSVSKWTLISMTLHYLLTNSDRPQVFRTGTTSTLSFKTEN